jgi:hypothetical protein
MIAGDSAARLLLDASASSLRLSKMRLSALI